MINYVKLIFIRFYRWDMRFKEVKCLATVTQWYNPKPMIYDLSSSTQIKIFPDSILGTRDWKGGWIFLPRKTIFGLTWCLICDLQGNLKGWMVNSHSVRLSVRLLCHQGKAGSTWCRCPRGLSTLDGWPSACVTLLTDKLLSIPPSVAQALIRGRIRLLLNVVLEKIFIQERAYLGLDLYKCQHTREVIYTAKGNYFLVSFCLVQMSQKPKVRVELNETKYLVGKITWLLVTEVKSKAVIYIRVSIALWPF